ncbi:MAG TPA: Gfo/Idh/MocA family oxidoreductase [Bacteroidota bacterium]|nr:Gfo/Idh/MocA family oxidoreductase [Bacteroidota bacterium]
MTAIGVIGVGHLGSLHAKMLAAIPDVTFGGVTDADASKAAALAAELKTQVFPTMDALLDRVEAVTVAAPTSAHHAIALHALKRGKHVFVEKPITETVAQAEELCSAAAAGKLVLQVGHVERFNPAILALESYRLAPMFVESHRLAQFNPRGTDVAVVLDLMIHDIDLILSFVQSPVKQVDASGIAVVSDSVDIANARLQFDNGCVANVTASRISQKKMRKMRLFQQNGYISIDFSQGIAEVFRLVESEDEHIEGTLMLGELGSGKHRRKIVYEQPEVKEVNALRYELESFARCIARGERPIVSGDDGRRALEVANLILRKIEEQKIAL